MTGRYMLAAWTISIKQKTQENYPEEIFSFLRRGSASAKGTLRLESCDLIYRLPPRKISLQAQDSI